jgi:hypothetical protein
MINIEFNGIIDKDSVIKHKERNGAPVRYLMCPVLTDMCGRETTVYVWLKDRGNGFWHDENLKSMQEVRVVGLLWAYSCINVDSKSPETVIYCYANVIVVKRGSLGNLNVRAL